VGCGSLRSMTGSPWRRRMSRLTKNCGTRFMPEMRFSVHRPNGALGYSPSLVIKDYFSPGETYALGDFAERRRTASTVGSDRVLATYGQACSRAKAQLATLTALPGRLPSVTIDMPE
jgi:uncharacterized repeat protein (TIGR04042 family)